MSTLFQTLHHVCIVVHDIERSEAYYQSVGIGPWQDYPPLSDYTRLTVPDPEAFSALRYRTCTLANVTLQLCQPPLLDCAQRRFLDSHGEGVFHLGFESDIESALRQAPDAGLQVLMQGQRENGTGFVYYDTLDAAGVVLMNRQTLPTPS